MAKSSRIVKRCKMCHKMKSLREYYVNKLEGDGHDSLCKKCTDTIRNNK